MIMLIPSGILQLLVIIGMTMVVKTQMVMVSEILHILFQVQEEIKIIYQYGALLTLSQLMEQQLALELIIGLGQQVNFGVAVLGLFLTHMF